MTGITTRYFSAFSVPQKNFNSMVKHGELQEETPLALQ